MTFFEADDASVRSHPSDGPFPRPVPKLSDSVFELFSMKGKVTAITGGGGGIGFAAAEAIAEAGGDVALLYRSAPNMDERAAKLGSKFNIKCLAYKCEVTDFDSVNEAVQRVKTEFGRLDCFIANAGGGVPGSIDENYAVEDWNKTMAVNLHSTFYAAKAVAPIFREQGNGSFIATTSISASIVNVPYPQAPYNASKAAVVHFCRSLAQDWRNFGRVNCISPGFFDTPMGPSDDKVADVVHRMSVLGRAGDVKELKGAYLYLASNASTYTTGSELLVDGGYTLS